MRGVVGEDRGYRNSLPHHAVSAQVISQTAGDKKIRVKVKYSSPTLRLQLQDIHVSFGGASGLQYKV